jgi:hypothetical protein
VASASRPVKLFLPSAEIGYYLFNNTWYKNL